jgi:hypothetical protein
MKLKFKEDPKEWRKAVLFGALGLAILSSLLRWRRVLPPRWWMAALSLLVVLALTACVRPRWFRGYYRFGTRIGYAVSQVAARVLLALIFFLVLTPLGLLLRLSGKDLLRLKRSSTTSTYWLPAKETSPLDRSF